MRRARKVYAVGFVYLDAANCDSTTSYKIVKGRRISGDITLSDCGRKIDWYFSIDDGGVVKIDRALAILQEFRAHFLGAHKKEKRK